MTTIDLATTLERLRAEKYPELDAILVQDIISIQTDFMESEAPEAYKRLSQRLEEFLQEQAGDNNA